MSTLTGPFLLGCINSMDTVRGRVDLQDLYVRGGIEVLLWGLGAFLLHRYIAPQIVTGALGTKTFAALVAICTALVFATLGGVPALWASMKIVGHYCSPDRFPIATVALLPAFLFSAHGWFSHRLSKNAVHTFGPTVRTTLSAMALSLIFVVVRHMFLAPELCRNNPW